MGRRQGWQAAGSGLASMTAALAVCYLALLLWLSTIALLPTLAGWTPYVVTSGSMAPRIPAGTVLVAAPPPESLVAPGAVVVFSDPLGRTITHRVVGVEAGRYRTKGDANPATDTSPVAHEQLRGAGRIVVPLIGLPVVWALQGRWALTGLAAVTTLAAAWIGARVLVTDGPPPGVAEPGVRPAGRSRARRPGRGKLPVVVGVLALTTLCAASVTSAGATFLAAADQPANRWAAAPQFGGPPSASATVSDLPRAATSASQTFTFTLDAPLPAGATISIDLTEAHRGPVDYLSAAAPAASLGVATLETRRGRSPIREAEIVWQPPVGGLAAGVTVTITLPSGIVTADVEVQGLPVSFTRTDTGAVLHASFAVS